jgi:hypothetical protein
MDAVRLIALDPDNGKAGQQHAPQLLDGMFSLCSNDAPMSRDTAMAAVEELRFKIVRTNSHDEVIALANNLLVACAAYETARRLYPHDRVDYRDGARVIARSEPEIESVVRKK